MFLSVRSSPKFTGETRGHAENPFQTILRFWLFFENFLSFFPHMSVEAPTLHGAKFFFKFSKKKIKILELPEMDFPHGPGSLRWLLGTRPRPPGGGAGVKKIQKVFFAWKWLRKVENHVLRRFWAGEHLKTLSSPLPKGGGQSVQYGSAWKNDSPRYREYLGWDKNDP